MKKVVIWVMLLTFFASAAPVNLFSSLSQSSADNQDGQSDAMVGEYNVGIKDELAVGAKVNINLPSKSIETIVTNIWDDGNHSNDTYGFSALSEDKRNILSVTSSNKTIIGSISTTEKMYRFISVSDSNITMKSIPITNFKDHDDSYIDDVNENFLNLTDNNTSDNLSDGNIITYSVIVAYDHSFSSELGDNQSLIANYMQTLERETNEAYENSNVNARVKIVHNYLTNYQKQGSFQKDMTYFKNTSNQYTQELHRLRNQYAADIMILLLGNGYVSCGLAQKIGADESQAFAIVKSSCGIGYYTFGHEIGHLFGARHIVYRDPSDVPFSFGHGYCSPDADWRTVMAYGCQNHAYPRIQQWSNPNVSINGIPTGTQNLEYNAKVLNIRARYISNFRVPVPLPNKGNEVAWLIPAIYYPMLLAL